MNKERKKLNDFEIDNILETRYKDVPASKITADSPSNSTVDSDFKKASTGFWLSINGGKYYQKYNEGQLSGQFNTKKPTFKTVSETYINSIKNIIRMKYDSEDKTSEEIKPYLEILENVTELINDKLDHSLDTPIDGDEMLAYIHGMLNTLIDNTKNK